MRSLIVEQVVGYMLKVLKAQLDVAEYKQEFDAIRHGDYANFIRIVGKEIDFLVSYKNGFISNETKPLDDDIDFAGLLKSSASLEVFYRKCFATFGHIVDPDLTDADFSNAVSFELSLRMHANNNGLILKREKLQNVIDALGKFKGLKDDEIQILHLGRNFINRIKHPKRKVINWKAHVSSFNSAREILERNNLNII